MRSSADRHLHIIYWFILPLNILSENSKAQIVMKSKKIHKRKTLAYAVAVYFTDASVKFMKYEALVVSDEKVGDKEIQIL